MSCKIYCLCSKDPKIKKIYVGSTLNAKKRMISHKYDSKYRCNTKVYKYINQNGGIEKWEMKILEEPLIENRFQCERKHIDENRNYVLNVQNPLTDLERLNYKKNWCECNKFHIKRYKKEYGKKQYHCQECDVDVAFNNRTRHMRTNKHILNKMLFDALEDF